MEALSILGMNLLADDFMCLSVSLADDVQTGSGLGKTAARKVEVLCAFKRLVAVRYDGIDACNYTVVIAGNRNHYIISAGRRQSYERFVFFFITVR